MNLELICPGAKVARRRGLRGHARTGLLGLAFLFLVGNASANGIYDNGTGARSMAMGGADVAWAADPLGAMGVNPAGLGFLTTPALTLGAFGGFVDGHFDKPGISSGDLDGNLHGLPEGAIAMPLGQWPVVVGLSFVPESSALVDWHYPDPPGGLGGISYGQQQDKAEILNLRTALGIAGQVTPQLSIGASVGLVYNKNELETPYIFQNLQPAAGLSGAKTLLDLETEGLGWDAQVGVIYRPHARPAIRRLLSKPLQHRLHRRCQRRPQHAVRRRPGHPPFPL